MERLPQTRHEMLLDAHTSFLSSFQTPALFRLWTKEHDLLCGSYKQIVLLSSGLHILSLQGIRRAIYVLADLGDTTPNCKSFTTNYDSKLVSLLGHMQTCGIPIG